MHDIFRNYISLGEGAGAQEGGAVIKLGVAPPGGSRQKWLK